MRFTGKTEKRRFCTGGSDVGTVRSALVSAADARSVVTGWASRSRQGRSAKSAAGGLPRHLHTVLATVAPRIRVRPGMSTTPAWAEAGAATAPAYDRRWHSSPERTRHTRSVWNPAREVEPEISLTLS